MKKIKLLPKPTSAILFCLVATAALNPAKTFAFDITAVGSFQDSNLTTNYGNGGLNDSVVSNGVTITNNGISSGTSFGGGVLISEFFNPYLSLEDGLLYLPRSINETQTFSAGAVSGTISENFNFYYLQVPVLLRLHFQDLFSVGFGGYYAHTVGTIKYTFSSSNAAVQAGLPSGTQSTGYQSNGIPQTDVGLLFAFGAKVPVSDTHLSIYGDARYAMGLKNLQTTQLTSLNTNDSSDNNKWHDFQLLVGLSYSFGTSSNALPQSADKLP
jgi:hypothetical protein